MNINSWCQTKYAEYKYLSLSKITSKFVANLLKYTILFKGILIILVLDYRDSSLIKLYLVVVGIFQKLDK